MAQVLIGVIGSYDNRYGRDIMIGIGERVGLHPDWTLRVLRATPEDRAWFRRWADQPYAGFLCYPPHPWVIEDVIATGKPFVSLGAHPPGAAGVRVRVDNRLVGEAAAHDLIERGFAPLAMVTMPSLFAEERLAGFAAVAAARGVACEVFALQAGMDQDPHRYDEQAARLEAWLAARATGSAVFAANDHIAHDCLAALRRRGVDVPGQVAVLGVDDDETMCLTAQPQLSSVMLPGATIGRLAVDTLARILRGEQPGDPPRPPPVGIATRRSTDAIAIPDPELARAIRFAREHVAEGVVVEQLARAAGLSRRVLEQRFQAVLGRTPMAEIRNAQVERARLLLATTDTALGDVAVEAGFGNIWTFSRVFRQVQGMPPRDYRRRFRS